MSWLGRGGAGFRLLTRAFFGAEDAFRRAFGAEALPPAAGADARPVVVVRILGAPDCCFLPSLWSAVEEELLDRLLSEEEEVETVEELEARFVSPIGAGLVWHTSGTAEGIIGLYLVSKGTAVSQPVFQDSAEITINTKTPNSNFQGYTAIPVSTV